MAYSQTMGRSFDEPVVSAYGPDDVRCTIRRFLAYTVDGMLMAALLGLISYEAGWWQTTTVMVTSATGQQVPISQFHINAGPGGWALATALGFGYFIVLEWALGWTIGKLLFGLRVVDFTGNQISIGQSIVRNLLRVVDDLFGSLVGLIAMLTSDRRQRVGDRAAGTLVVRRSIFG